MPPGEGPDEEPDSSRSPDRQSSRRETGETDPAPKTGDRSQARPSMAGEETGPNPEGGSVGPADDAVSSGRPQSREATMPGPGPAPKRGRTRPGSVTGWIWWFLTVREGWPVFVREVLSSVIAVLFVGLLLFAASGVWPPMVAVESGSMEPHMFRGDLVFIMEEHRLAPDFSHSDTGIVTYEDGRAADYTRFGSYGDVIVFDSPQNAGPPIIHRARFWVEADENWYGRADPAFLNGDDCASTPNCPAPNAGFITRGDANPTYDQVSGIARPVRPEWITGTAEVRVPWLGYIRLEFSELSLDTDGSLLRSAMLTPPGTLVPTDIAG